MLPRRFARRHRTARFIRAIGLAALLSLPALATAQAQFIDRVITPDLSGVADQPGVTVLTRARPDYSPPDVRLGSFLLTGNLSQSLGYDDNVTGFKPFRGSSLLETTAELAARSDWSRNALFGALSVDNTQYFDISRQSAASWTASFGGTIEFGRDRLNFNYAHDNLEAGSRELSVPNLDKPVAIVVDDAVMLYQAVFNRLTVQPGLDVTAYSFQDGSAKGVPYRQSVRDRDVLAPSITARYAVAPLSDLIAVTQISLAQYNKTVAGIPNYVDVIGLAGYDTTIGEILRLVLLGGYEQRSFNGSQIKSVQAPLALLRVTWSPTGLTTLRGTLTRRITDTAIDFTATTKITQASFRIDHELRRNILLHALAGAELDNYAGGGGSVTLYNAGLGAEWLLNRYMVLSATYNVQIRQRGGGAVAASGAPNYVNNQYMLSLQLKL